MDDLGFDPERDLPDIAPEDNPLVWCERCQRTHRTYTFTRADWHTVRDAAVEKLRAAIDEQAFKAVYRRSIIEHVGE